MMLLRPGNVLKMMGGDDAEDSNSSQGDSLVSPPRLYLTLILPQPKTHLFQEIFSMILLG
jgi:hypothetical protein